VDVARIREIFAVDDAIVSSLSRPDLTGTSQERYQSWVQHLGGPRQLDVEYLLPRIHQAVEPSWPSFVDNRPAPTRSPEQLRAEIERLGPWSIPFPLADGVKTMGDDMVAAVTEHRMLFRRDLIGKTVAGALADTAATATVLDVGCNSGFFSMDLIDRGIGHVSGVDLRPKNIAQANFLAEHYGVAGADFRVADVDDLDDDAQFDVVLNLGLLYHVVNPLQVIRRTYELCRRFAIIDTVCHREAVSGYFIFGNKDVELPEEGRETYELHPTYRGAIDTIRFAGFREVYEVVGDAEKPHDLYRIGGRRCFLAIK
jgi:SAM-dependent methyltransferase